ncbi:MAG: NF038122 family metalloprotease [Caulobacteraceae bacterium]
MSLFHDDLTGFGPLVSPHFNPFTHGPQVIYDEGVLSPIGQAGGGGHGGGHGGGGTTTAPAPTLVSGVGSNLAIDLVWDASVASAPVGFMSAVTASAQTLANDLTTAAKTVLYIAVGWGEIAGGAISAGALGESESSGYLTSYATVANALKAHGDNLTASNEPTSAQFFVTSAEAKLLGMAGPTSGSATAVDGYVGFGTLAGTGYSWNFGATGTTSTQFNLRSVVDHELTEVMGRISMEGTAVYYGQKTYTPLDLFDFSASGTLSLSNSGGYFSNDNGVSHLGNFNPASLYKGDIGDWASYNAITESGTVTSGQDAFNAYGRPGYDGILSKDDLLEMVALGYSLTATGSAVV